MMPNDFDGFDLAQMKKDSTVLWKTTKDPSRILDAISPEETSTGELPHFPRWKDVNPGEFMPDFMVSIKEVGIEAIVIAHACFTTYEQIKRRNPLTISRTQLYLNGVEVRIEQEPEQVAIRHREYPGALYEECGDVCGVQWDTQAIGGVGSKLKGTITYCPEGNTEKVTLPVSHFRLVTVCCEDCEHGLIATTKIR